MKIYWVIITILGVAPVFAQKKVAPPEKRPLTHSVYDFWNEIPFKALTPDGKYAVLLINPQDGDGKAVFVNLKTFKEDSVRRASEISITADSKNAVLKIKPQQKLVKDLRRHKKKKEELPKDSLVIYSFENGSKEKIAEVKSYQIPEKSGGWVAYQLEPAKEQSKPAKEEPQKAKLKKQKKSSDDNGYTLVLRKLSDQTERKWGFVKDFTLAKRGQGLLFSSTGNDSTLKPGMYWYDFQSELLTRLHEGFSKYKYKGLSVSEDGSQAAFLVDTDTTKAPIHHFKLYYWKKETAAGRAIDIENSQAIPQNWMVSENYTPLFSKDGSRLFVGTSPKPVIADTTLLPEEIVNVEVWRGEDEYIYPYQNKQLDNEKKRSYLAVIDLANNTLQQLGEREVPVIEIGNEGNSTIYLGSSNTAYRKMITWDTSPRNDLYVYDLKDRSRKLVGREINGNSALSPRANYVFWFSLPDTAWFAYSVQRSSSINLTQGIPVRFANEEDDHPDFPSPYGYAGWTTDDAQLLVYDRYDIWSLDPVNSKPAVNLTKIGRDQKIIFRYIQLEKEDRFINSSGEILLSAFNEVSRESGFYKLSLKDGKLTKLIMAHQQMEGVVKAKNVNQILFTRESFRQFPDVWSSDLNFNGPQKISDANPQMKNYLWGNVELMKWTSSDNIPLEGLLYKPEDFDPKKKYPMIVYFYEKSSEELNHHYMPAPIRSYINFSLYSSNGYLVFVPDIVYKIGFPGESAYNCIMPGVTNLIAKGFVDEKHIGIQGHSWGGYQTAYIITRTNLFAAAEAGAPVSNMTSAYGGVRWETGLSRMFQYEHTQSRIGGTLWEKTMHYIENSPLFFADKIKTPVLMMHNDGDGAVPWYQGIEFYMALRRLHKPVWMLNYNQQGHGLSQRQDKTDFSIRMMQFFDHYLKGSLQPDWMKKGVPAIEKGITKGY